MTGALRRLSTKYALVIAAVLLLCMALVLMLAGYFVFRGTNDLRGDLSDSFSAFQSVNDLRTLRASSTYLGQRLFDPLYNLDVTALNAEIALISDWLQPRSVFILDDQGRLVTDGTSANPDHGRKERIPEALAQQQSVIEPAEDGKRIYFRIAHEGSVIGYARIAFSNDRQRALLTELHNTVEVAWQRFEQWFLSIGVVGFAVVVLVSVGVAWRLSISLSRPLREMSRAAEQFASGNLTHQLPAHADDELGRLASSLNRMAKDLRRAGRLLMRAQEMASFGSWEWRPGQERLHLSHGVYAILGLVHGSHPCAIADVLERSVPPDRDRFESLLRGRFETPVSCELRILREDGQMRSVLVKGESERSEDGRLIASFGTIQDITEQQHAQAQLTRLANFDVLTGLPNRNLFYDRLRQALRKAQREQRQVALLFLDLDRFKEINDALGHDVGDALLRAAAQRLQECMRDSDTLARMGGDEFVLMIEDFCEPTTPSTVARKLLGALGAPFSLAERELFISASVGIALFPQDANDLETLIKHADIAMYAAKEQGKGAFHFFTSELQRVASERLALEQQLRQAIERAELYFHFQPQVRAADSRFVGIEALLRWGHGETSVSPARFIPILEETGLITRVTEQALREACTALKALELRGLADLRAAINLSARQLKQPDLLGLIQSVLKTYEVRAKQLEVEITESTLLDDAQCQTNAAQLSTYGVRLAIDDFGTGYSSLTYLKRFDVDALKVDRSFIADLLLDKDDAQIVGAVIGLAQGLGIDSVAEGVEDLAQRARLESLGCDFIQGYLIARPMSLDELLTWAGNGGSPGKSEVVATDQG